MAHGLHDAVRAPAQLLDADQVGGVDLMDLDQGWIASTPLSVGSVQQLTPSLPISSSLFHCSLFH